ncbi:MAG: sigma 54-interacting transcriptional regulator [Deltaproteobacteria bacterium]|nr:sigma 54-interacting transcriptional regulator [Deltaproteobacteria bacterium]
MAGRTPELTTTRVVNDLKAPKLLRRKVRLEVLRGVDAGKQVVAGEEELHIGTLSDNDLVLTDSAVSRCHLRIVTGLRGFTITDLDSTNGTFVGPLRLREVTVSQPVELLVGDSTIRLTPLDDEVEVPLHGEDRFGSVLGRSAQMRAIFAQLPAVGASEATVLIEGETGTGKELLAEELHRASPRRTGPFVVVDCGAIPETLIESELFGHVRGSFTGANADRTGAFELADGGTLFLDEIGELSASAQPKLLRALESRQIKPVGSPKYRSIDARIVCATHRDLRRAINEGGFRPDLYYRISVIRMHLPPLRERPEDVELLATHFLGQLTSRLAPGATAPSALGRETLQRLVNHRWPGNIRELRNFMERVAVMAHGGPALSADPDGFAPAAAPSSDLAVDLHLPYKDAKARWIDRFEVDYVTDLLRRANGNVAAAARDAGVDRTYLFRLIRKYGLREGE